MMEQSRHDLKVRRALKLMRRAEIGKIYTKQYQLKGLLDNFGVPLPYDPDLLNSDIVLNLKSTRQLAADGKANYALNSGKKNKSQKIENSGKLRSINPALIEDIMREQKELRAQAKAQELLRKERSQIISAPSAGEGGLSETGERSMTEPSLHEESASRARSASSQNQEVDRPEAEFVEATSDSPRPRRQSLLDASSPYLTNQRKNVRPSSRQSRDKEREKTDRVIELKREMQEHQDEERKRKFAERQKDRGNRAHKLELEQRQRKLLAVVTMLKWVNNARTDPKFRKARREYLVFKYMYMCALMKIMAMRMVRAYRQRKIRHTLLTSGKTIFFVSFAVRRFWARSQLRKRRDAVGVLKLFLAEAIPKSTMVRKMYNFRKHIIRAQRWAKTWIAIRRTRLQLLWLAWGAVEQLYRSKKKEDRKRILNNSLKAASKMKGFAGTIVQLNTSQTRLQTLLEAQAKHNRKVLQEQRRLFASNSSSGSRVGRASSARQRGADGGGGGEGRRSPRDDSAPFSPDARMISEKMKENMMNSGDDMSLFHVRNEVRMAKLCVELRAPRKQVQILETLLKKQRKEHMLYADALRESIKRRTIALDDAKLYEYLRNPKGVCISQVIGGLKEANQRRIPTPPFLLLTDVQQTKGDQVIMLRGALHHLRNLPEDQYTPLGYSRSSYGGESRPSSP